MPFTNTLESERIFLNVKKRNVRIKDIYYLNLKMKVLTFMGEELSDIESYAADDNIKMMIPLRNGELSKKSYSLLRVDNHNNEVDICFYLHGQGAVSQWAEDAEIGDEAIIGGPKSSVLFKYNFENYLFVADETSIPSVLRRLKELPPEARVSLVFEVDSEDHKIPLDHTYENVIWIFRDEEIDEQAPRFIKRIEDLNLEPEKTYSWVRVHKKASKSIAAYLVAAKGFNPDHITSKGYWS